MIFISLGKFRDKPTKEMTDEASRIIGEMSKEGLKILSFYWTLGQYDAVVIMEAKDEKAAMKIGLRISGIVSTETLVGLSREEAHKLLE